MRFSFLFCLSALVSPEHQFCSPVFAGINQGSVVQSVVSLTSSLRVISLTILVDSIYNILIFFAEKMWVAFALQCKSYSHFFCKKFQHICVSLDVNFNESLTNDVVSFEQLGPELHARSHFAPWLLPTFQNLSVLPEKLLERKSALKCYHPFLRWLRHNI